MITRTTIAGNNTTGAGASTPGGPELPQGAGIASFMLGGSMAIDSSTISGNVATGVNGNPTGGGLYLDTTLSGAAATYTLTNSTISGNTATSAVSDGANGGGIASSASGAANPPNVTLTHVTVAGNTASLDSAAPLDSGLGGNIFVGSGANLFDLRATIIADGTSGVAGTENCGLEMPGRIESLGENVEDTTPTQCELDGLGDQVGADPMLGPLTPADGGDPANGIPAATMALLAGSPAINSVPAGGLCPATDQRGVTRPQGPACDAGAYEIADSDADGIPDIADSCPGQAGPASSGGCPLPLVNPPVTTPLTPTTPVAPKKKKKCKKKKRKGAAAAKKCKRKKR
jgi:hypothetical protein